MTVTLEMVWGVELIINADFADNRRVVIRASSEFGEMDAVADALSLLAEKIREECKRHGKHNSAITHQ